MCAHVLGKDIQCTFPKHARTHTVREFVNKSAASAASPDYVKFQAVIKSAASAASREPKSREGSSRERPGDRGRWDDGGGRTTDQDSDDSSGRSLELPSRDLGFLEAALAADLITA